MSKMRYSVIINVILFFVGSLLVFIGLSKGNDIATSLSRPSGATFWSVSSELILGCTYTPAIMGIALIVLSMIFSTILFTKWLKDKE